VELKVKRRTESHINTPTNISMANREQRHLEDSSGEEEAEMETSENTMDIIHELKKKMKN
jgi:hypothetical protein